MGRPRRYTGKRLREAVERYFLSISRIVDITEMVPTGELDKNGHTVYAQKTVCNQLGEPAKRLEYLIPPTVGGLCMFLKIHRSTWNEWSDSEKYPEFSDTITHARGRMRAYLDQELLTRKDVKGVIFDLENNYGCRESVQITGSVEKYLSEHGEVQSF